MSVRPSGHARLRAVLAPVLALALFAALVTALPTAAGATRHRRVAHTCDGFANAIPHTAVWKDYRSERSPLPRNIGKLICSAANGATIDIKSWFFKIDDKFTQHLVHKLRLMHTYHHVRVHVFVGRNARHVDWRGFLHEFDFAYIGWCNAACKSSSATGVSHSKWITVSKLRNGNPAVLSTSVNWSHQQFASVEQSGVFVSGNTALYRDFVNRWDIYQHCFQRKCDTTPGTSGWEQAGHFAVHFAPSSNDAIADELSTVECGRFGHVWVASLFFHRPEVHHQLVRLIRSGCEVRVLLARPFTTYLADSLNPRQLREHDKYVVIWASNAREVIAGSEDLGTHEMSADDNQMLRVRVPQVVSSYNALFAHQWRMAHIVSPETSVAHVNTREES